jgi:hypothetical protein
VEVKITHVKTAALGCPVEQARLGSGNAQVSHRQIDGRPALRAVEASQKNAADFSRLSR